MSRQKPLLFADREKCKIKLQPIFNMGGLYRSGEVGRVESEVDDDRFRRRTHPEKLLVLR